MKIYVMRHGTTVWNEKGITQGRSQNRLSRAGINIAKKRAEELKDVKLDIIFSSPLMRTMQTSNIVNKFHNIKIIKDQRLIEVDQGVFTKRHKDSYTEEEKRIRALRLNEYGLENKKQIYDRCLEFVNFLKTQNQYKKVLVVSHNAVVTCLFDILAGLSEKEILASDFGGTFSNAEVRVVDL